MMQLESECLLPKNMKMKKKLLPLILSLIIVIVSIPRGVAQPQPCPDCGRRGMVVEFNNPSNPDYEQKRQEWRDCMTELLGNYVSFSDDDPKIAEASEKCSGLVPENDAYCFPEIVSGYLGQHHSNACFRLLNAEYFSKIGGKEPEYIFKGSYEPNLEGGRIVEAVTDVFKPIVAQMTLNLYYNGTTPELVRTWFAESTLNSPQGLLHKLNIPKSIKPIFDDFEKRPVRCDVKIPLPEEICENGTAEIELSGFSDINGNSSKSFNRIIVSIYKGEILNGENSDFGPDWKVFTVGEGTVRVRYRPPEDKEDGWEWLRIYNSCEILPPEKSPISSTQMDSLIVDQRFPIACGFYKGNVTITKSWNYKEEHANYASTYTGTEDVSFSGVFKLKNEMEGMEDQPIKIYEATSAVGSWKYNEDRYCEGQGCGKCQGLVMQEYGSGSLPPLTMTGIMIMTYSFPTGQKEVADQLAQFGLVNWYDISTPGDGVPTEEKSKSEIDKECVWTTRTTSQNLTGTDIRFKLEDIGNLEGSVSWSSSRGKGVDVSITNMPDAPEGQKPFDPEQDGTDFKYTVSWNLKLL
jgi:hypothetical protein